MQEGRKVVREEMQPRREKGGDVFPVGEGCG